MRRRGKQWIGFLVMVIGAALLLGPFIQGDIETKKQENYVAELHEMLNRATSTPATMVPTATMAPTATSAATATPTVEPVATHTPTAAPEVSEEPTVEPTELTTDAPIATEEPTNTPESSSVPTATLPVDAEATPAEQDTPTATEPAQSTVTSVETPMCVSCTPTAVVSATPTPTAAATDTPAPTATVMATPEATETEEPQITAAVEPVGTPDPMDEFFQEAVAYNESLVKRGQWGMDSLADLERFQLDAKKYGFSDNVIGTISIPRLDVEVALYLGTTSEHMANGFAVFGMTSVPLGLGVENVAIAGHRGWRGAAMLRDVQMIMLGDPIYITTPWRTLTYIVSGIEIVSPQNNNWCKLKPGKTMISLMTCHPYGQHTHRYIVYAELLQDEQEPVDTPEMTLEPEMPEITPVGTYTLLIQRTEAAQMLTTAPTAAASEKTATQSPVATEQPVNSSTVNTTEQIVSATPTSSTAATTAPTIESTVTVEPESTAAAATTAEAEATGTATAVPVTAAPVSTATALVTPSAVPAVKTAVPSATASAMRQEITLVHDDGTREVIVIDTTAINPDDREYSTEWSNTLIMAENNMRPVAYVTAGIVALVGLWLVIATLRDRKKEKRGQHDD